MRHTQGLLKSVLSSIGEGVIIADAHGRILMFNEAASRFFDPRLIHCKPDQYAQTFGLFLADGKTPAANRDLPLHRGARGEHTDHVQLFVRNSRVPQGAWINTSGRPLRNAQGRLIGSVAVFRDITEFKHAEQEIVEISGREQRRIGQDLHDGLCQTILAAQFTGRVLAEKMRGRALRPLRADLREMQEHLHNAIAQADVIARGLYPVELDTQGLMAALKELAPNMERTYHIRCRFVCPKPVKIARPGTASHLYRIAQEAVFNAIKGGGAKQILIRLTGRRGQGTLSVVDNGCGISPNPRRRGMGLALMAYRARMINATLDIERRKSGGTRVLCKFPQGIP